jgi:hypothetical protein
MSANLRPGWVTDADIDDLTARCAPHTDGTAQETDGDVLPFPHQPAPPTGNSGSAGADEAGAS